MDTYLRTLLDGATATNLYSMGMPIDCCREEWILSNPDKLIALQKEFVKAGSEIILTPTFSANSFQLEKYGLEEKTVEINKELVKLTKTAAGLNAKVAGCISMTGALVTPFGEVSFSAVFAAYSQQAKALYESGVDLFYIETMTSMTELRAAAIACLKYDIPTYATIYCNEDGITPSGASALACLITLQELGVSAFGVNCSLADEAAPVIKELYPYSKIPLIAKPSAGLLFGSDGFSYDYPADRFVHDCRLLSESGAEIIGGCCGITPEHIKALNEADGFIKRSNDEQSLKEDTSLVLCSHNEVFFLNPDNIEVSESLTCGVDMADKLIDFTDTSFDMISVLVDSADDSYIFSKNSHMTPLPVLFCSEDELALKTALLTYQGRAAIDSHCGIDQEVLEEIARKYGAVLY